MLEIIPNWHPIFVHFTVALFSLSVILFAVTLFMTSPLKEQWLIVARWTLWFGAGFTVLTGLSGLDAYNTVAHDTPSHVAMTDHRNWAIATISLFMTLAIWSFIRVRRQLTLGTTFVVIMVIAGGLLAATAWHGGEVVYRYGLGVMSLPKAEGEGHAHEHADGAGHGDESDSDHSTKATKKEHREEGHAHDTISGHDELSVEDQNIETNDAISRPKKQNDDGHDHEH